MEEQRLEVIQCYEEGLSISELAEIYKVSRKTIYKWVERYEQMGMAGLADLSRRPHHSPNTQTAHSKLTRLV